jgi:hypothetical protein
MHWEECKESIIKDFQRFWWTLKWMLIVAAVGAGCIWLGGCATSKLQVAYKPPQDVTITVTWEPKP